MLVLTRKIDQGFVISGNIYVRVLGIQRDRVTIGISAPLEVRILRQELLEREESGESSEGSQELTIEVPLSDSTRELLTQLREQGQRTQGRKKRGQRRGN